MSERERLSNRRAAEKFDFEHGGRKWTATIGRFPDGRVAEIFIHTPKFCAIAELAAEAGSSAASRFNTAVSSKRFGMPSTDATPAPWALR
jgi:hypothetical protein